MLLHLRHERVLDVWLNQSNCNFTWQSLHFCCHIFSSRFHSGRPALYMDPKVFDEPHVHLGEAGDAGLAGRLAGTGQGSPSNANGIASRGIARVPIVTPHFWLIKVLATTVGEATADWMADDLGLGLYDTALVFCAIFTGWLMLQLYCARYVPAIYWTAVVLVSTTGTLVTDSLHDGAGLENWYAAILWGVCLSITMFLWYKREHTLAMKSICTLRRELFYWTAVFFTFCFGTAVGDLFLDDIGMPLYASILLFAGLIGLTALLWYRKWIGDILAFWVAYILTRPLGGSLGDFLSVPPDETGLGLGPMTTSLIFLSIIFLTVTFLTLTKRDHYRQPAGPGELTTSPVEPLSPAVRLQVLK
eukprot:g69054.t1